MLNKEKHQLIMGRILRDIYSDVSISSLLGFKGGTAAYFFYGLTRFSVDLDFDLLVVDETNQEVVYEKVALILKKYGEVKDQYRKQNTIFFLLSYGDVNCYLKVEISAGTLITDIKKHYHLKEYLGISMLTAKKDYLFASKLVALTERKMLAMRDIYDIWFFAKNNWDINSDVIKVRTNKTIKEHIADCLLLIEGVKENQILHGLAEFLPNEKNKLWVKDHLKEETIFLLKNYQRVLENG